MYCGFQIKNNKHCHHTSMRRVERDEGSIYESAIGQLFFNTISKRDKIYFDETIRDSLVVIFSQSFTKKYSNMNKCDFTNIYLYTIRYGPLGYYYYFLIEVILKRYNTRDVNFSFFYPANQTKNSIERGYYKYTIETSSMMSTI